MTSYIVATVDEIKPGQRKLVTIKGREIGVFNVQGRFFAVRNRCPHMAGPLCEGRVAGVVTSTVPGEYVFERKGEIIRCPWHQWEFDLATGQSWFDPARVRVRAYETRIAKGDALVGADAKRAEASGATGPDRAAGAGADAVGDGERTVAGRLPGPYRAEVYEVSVEDSYVVVSLDR